MSDYIKCPRCELNYIHKSQGYCDVCKAELKLGPALEFADLEDDELETESVLCPICKQNYISPDEDMCESCREDHDFKKEEPDVDVDVEKDYTWREFLDGDEKDETLPQDEELSLSAIEEKEMEEFFDGGDEDSDEEEGDAKSKKHHDEDDDFDFNVDDKDFEDDDDEDDDDEDDDDEDDDEDDDK